jgi:hypothetical protein
MSYSELLTHTLLVAHPNPATTADQTGQLFTDATGQPIGDATVDEDVDWMFAVEVPGLVQERTARWPEGPGAGPELVNTTIFLEAGVQVRELDKIKRTDIDPEQVYQAVFVSDAAGQGHHTEVIARRIPL